MRLGVDICTIDCDTNSWQWLEYLLPSIPTVAATVVGFFVFHKLAVRRQRRDEIYRVIQKAVETLEQYSDAAQKCWYATGKNARSEGLVVNFRAKAAQLGSQLEMLQHFDKRFEKIMKEFLQLNLEADEYESDDGLVAVDQVDRREFQKQSQRVKVRAKAFRRAMLRLYGRI